MFRSDKLAENGHAIAVEEAPADSEDDEEEHGHEQGGRVTHAEEGRQKQERTDRADKDTTADIRTHPAVGEPASEHRADDSGELPINDRGDPRLALAKVEAFAEDVRHPVAHDPCRHGGQGEVNHKKQEAGIAEERADGRACGRTGRCLLGRRSVAQE